MSGYFDEHGCAIVGNVAIPANLVPHFRELLASDPEPIKAPDVIAAADIIATHMLKDPSIESVDMYQARRAARRILEGQREQPKADEDPAASTPDGIHLIAHHAGTANLQSADGRWWNVTVS